MPPSAAAKVAHVLWLVPAQRERAIFRRIMARLAADHDAPAFAPHLTLGSWSAELPKRIETETFQLRVVGIFSSARFTKTLFIRFEAAPALKDLRASLGMPRRGFDPHLSLLYRDLPRAQKKELAHGIALPFAAVTFNALQLVRCPLPTSTRADVESWQIIATRRLARAT